jgi:riboflavin biosynthesis pyrimidine reductase
MIEYERLLPEPARLSAAELLADVRPQERAPADRPFVFLNMVCTVDGRATVEGRTAALGDEGDLEMLVELRTIADALLVGTNTLRAESYGWIIRKPERRARREAAGLSPDLPVVLITRSGDVPWEAGLFAASQQPVWIYAGQELAPPPVAAPVEVVALPDVAPATVLRHLRTERGVRGLLSEGGPTLNGSLFHDRLVDELFLSISPLLAGTDATTGIVHGEPVEDLQALELQSAAYREGELYLRYGTVH